MLDEVKTQLSQIVSQAVKSVIAKGDLTLTEIPEIQLQAPKSDEHGDLACPLALVLARSAKKAPRAIAQILVEEIEAAPHPLIKRVEIAGPGFMNFFLSNSYLYELLRSIQNQQANFGRSNIGHGERIVVEFVSANPTGPLNIVSGRAAATGDTLVNVLNATGYDAIREYYINDAGGQTLRFAGSVDARYRQLLGQAVEFPEDGYHGDYVTRFAQEIIDAEGARYLQMEESDRLKAFWQIVYPKIQRWQKDDLERFGVYFDVWTREQSIRDAKKPEEILQTLKSRELLYDAEGATWLRLTAFGGDKDCVVIKSDGEYTYITPDMAYHHDKFQRGFDRAIDLLGPDHHAQAGRLQTAMKALGYDESRLRILFVQQVNLVNERGERVNMSKRKGQLITLGELIDQLTGTVDERFAVDVARYFFLMRSSSSHLDFDLSLAIKRAQENPVFYLQYAHARVCSIFTLAKQRNIRRLPLEEVNLEWLQEPEEARLIKKLGEFPEVVQSCARTLEIHHLPHYLQEVAALFHTFYNKCRVLDEAAPELTQARLVLADCVRLVMGNGLSLLGISAPETM